MAPMKRTLLTVFKRLVISVLSSVALGFVAINLLALPDPATLPAPARSPVTVLLNVNVVDPRGRGSIAYQQMVVVVGNKITFVGAAGSRPIPKTARTLLADNKYLIPGLWDSHVHTLRLSPQLHFPLLIANGVTSVRDLGDTCSWSDSLDCNPETPRWRAQLESGEITGPRIMETVSYHLESAPEDDAEWEALLDTLKRRGERVLKIQLDEQVSPEEFANIVAVAERKGFQLAGHVPFSVDLAATTHAFRSIEHDSSLLTQCSDFRAQFDGRNRSKAALLASMNEPRCQRLLVDLAKRSVAYVPTHIASSGQDAAFAIGAANGEFTELTQRYVIAPQRWIWAVLRAAGKTNREEQQLLRDFHHAALRLSKQAHQAGVPVLAGSDALDAEVLHGLGLHQELQNLVSAGLTPAQALYAATAAPAKAFGMQSQLGLIEPGKLGDMVLLDANPLLDIRNTQQIHAVLADGRLYTESERSAALRYVAEQADRVSVICRFLRGLWFAG